MYLHFEYSNLFQWLTNQYLISFAKIMSKFIVDVLHKSNKMLINILFNTIFFYLKKFNFLQKT